jgi:hypothetical protein
MMMIVCLLPEEWICNFDKNQNKKVLRFNMQKNLSLSNDEGLDLCLFMILLFKFKFIWVACGCLRYTLFLSYFTSFLITSIKPKYHSTRTINIVIIYKNG